MNQSIFLRPLLGGHTLTWFYRWRNVIPESKVPHQGGLHVHTTLTWKSLAKVYNKKANLDMPSLCKFHFAVLNVYSWKLNSRTRCSYLLLCVIRAILCFLNFGRCNRKGFKNDVLNGYLRDIFLTNTGNYEFRQAVIRCESGSEGRGGEMAECEELTRRRGRTWWLVVLSRRQENKARQSNKK